MFPFTLICVWWESKHVYKTAELSIETSFFFSPLVAWGLTPWFSCILPFLLPSTLSFSCLLFFFVFLLSQKSWNLPPKSYSLWLCEPSKWHQVSIYFTAWLGQRWGIIPYDSYFFNQPSPTALRLPPLCHMYKDTSNRVMSPCKTKPEEKVTTTNYLLT